MGKKIIFEILLFLHGPRQREVSLRRREKLTFLCVHNCFILSEGAICLHVLQTKYSDFDVVTRQIPTRISQSITINPAIHYPKAAPLFLVPPLPTPTINPCGSLYTEGRNQLQAYQLIPVKTIQARMYTKLGHKQNK